MRSDRETSASTATGVMVLLAITILLAALVLLLMQQMPHLSRDEEIPSLFRIVSVRHTNDYNILNYESVMIVENSGDLTYDNKKLSAKTYRNGELLPCIIPYINGNLFIRHHPHGIDTLGGIGSRDVGWISGSQIKIDYVQGTFRPGDTVGFEVYDRDTGRIISRDIYPHTEETTEKRLMDLYLNRQGA